MFVDVFAATCGSMFTVALLMPLRRAY